jgi:hypothetical protein
MEQRVWFEPSEPHPQPDLDLALAVEIRCIHIERLAECGDRRSCAGDGRGSAARVAVGVDGEVAQGRQGAGSAARLDGIACGFELRHILVIEEIEALYEHFQLPCVAQVEFLAQAQVGLPRVGIAEGVAADIVGDAVVAETRGCRRRSRSCPGPGPQWRAGGGELLRQRAGRAHGVGQAAAELPDPGEHPAVAEAAGEAAQLPRCVINDHGGCRVAHIQIARCRTPG